MEVISYNNRFASGFKRLIAFFIDHLAIGAVLSLLTWQLFNWPFGFEDYSIMRWGNHNFLKELIIIIYYALMESSKYQATLGKMAMGIKVIDKNGTPVAFPKALLRNFSKILSALILGIGYLMIIFDSRKQGLHDKIADTYVVLQ